jgi:hypothetical protein
MIEQIRAALRLAADAGHVTPMGARIIELVLDQHAHPTDPGTMVEVTEGILDKLPTGSLIGISRLPAGATEPDLRMYLREDDGWYDPATRTELDTDHLIHTTRVLWRPDVDVAAVQWHRGWEAGVSHVEGPLTGMYQEYRSSDLLSREELLNEIGDLLDFLGK